MDLPRPQYANLRAASSESSPRVGSGALSPRVEYFDGEVPPALSPLDAFALQGRLLAKQLDESRRSNRRMSRLPPASVARSLSQPRPGYFRTPSSESQNGDVSPRRVEAGGNSPEVEDPVDRPRSEHPRLSGLSTLQSEDGQDDDDDEDTSQTPVVKPADDHTNPRLSRDYFPQPRVESPEPMVSAASIAKGASTDALPREPSTDSTSRLNVSQNLAPPASPLPRPFGNPRLPHTESSDDDYTSSNAGSTFSQVRKLSSSSGMSMPHSPLSPGTRSYPRSPSMSSEISLNGHLPRPSFNFSRPLSRSSTSRSVPAMASPPSEVPSRSPRPSCTTPEPSDSRRTSMSNRDSNRDSGSMNRERRPAPITLPVTADAAATNREDPASATTSYTYSKFSLPRGRMFSRDSLVFQALQTPHFEWQEPLFENSPPPSAAPQTDRFVRTPSPSPSTTSQPARVPKRSFDVSPARSLPGTRTVTDDIPAVPPLQMTVERPKTAVPTHKREASTGLGISHPADEQDDGKSASADSASTLRPQTGHEPSTPQPGQLTAEDHVAKGIQCHEQGSLKESTYHLRIAAMQNHPFGMLMYALACRHGWGMRPNQKEGIKWLRKAVDCAVLEVAEDGEDDQARGKDVVERKSRRAQFALSIYELGVSHLNGWGIEQDKALALRCFEIAGNWGDVDALAEAGFCYVQGVGCKKDLKKAAKFYRMAEAKGMSMVGNSWIYKDKYMSNDDEPTSTPSLHSTTPEKKNRNKSRTRSIFTRKKSVAST